MPVFLAAAAVQFRAAFAAPSASRLDASMRFGDDDGWALASHIALSALISMFPFLIVLTALAGFFGSKDLRR